MGVEQTTPVVEETKEETPKVVEETTGHTETTENGKTEEKNGEEGVHKDADYKTEEKAENGDKNGDAAENGHTEEKVAEKRKVEEVAAPEPIPVSAEKIAKLTETTEEEVNKHHTHRTNIHTKISILAQHRLLKISPFLKP